MVVNIKIVCRDKIVIRDYDHAGWVCRTKRYGFRRIPNHLRHYDGMTLSDRIYRIIERLAKKYKYIFPEEFKKLVASLKFKYLQSSTGRQEFKENIFSEYGLVANYQGWYLPETINRNEFLEVIQKLKFLQELDMKTTGDLRSALAKCFVEAMEGRLSGDALRGVIGCANQINTSIAVEIKARAQLTREGASTGALGEMYLNKQEQDNNE